MSSSEGVVFDKHDSVECGFNYRKERMTTLKFEFNKDSNICSLPFKTSGAPDHLLPGFNGQVSLCEGVLSIRLYTDDHTTGLYSHDLITLLRSIVNSLVPCKEHDAMKTLLMAVQLLKDYRGVVASNNFSESAIERNAPPSRKLYPTKAEWDAIYDLMMDCADAQDKLTNKE
jgi:hypothetical protein